MNNQQIEQYRKILADAQSIGETHYRPSSEKEMQYDSLGFVLQDLGNIKTIVEQAERIKELETYNLGLANESCAQQKRIAELENFVSDYANQTCDCGYPRICNTCKDITYAKEVLKKGVSDEHDF
jgi:hypothetical protein